MQSLFHQDVVVAPLGSGSRGNATYIGDGRTGVLVDCGLSTRQIFLRMERLGLGDAPIDAVLLTHEHADHIASAAILERHVRKKRGQDLEFAMTAGTARGIPDRCMPQGVRLIEAGTSFTVGGLRIEPTTIPHDTRDPVCYTVASGATRIGVITDLGTPTRLLVQQLASLDVAVLEFNHDVEMLLEGDYPWHLKQRIRGHHGHLSNDQAAKLLFHAAKQSRRLSHVVLAHLSDENNTQARAVAAAEEALDRAGRGLVEIQVAEQDVPVEPVRLSRPLSFDQPRPSKPRPRVTRVRTADVEVPEALQEVLFPSSHDA